MSAAESSYRRRLWVEQHPDDLPPWVERWLAAETHPLVAHDLKLFWSSPRRRRNRPVPEWFWDVSQFPAQNFGS